MYRQNKISFVLGKRGCGKTYYMRNKIILPTHKKGMKVLIVDTLDHPSYLDFQKLNTEREVRAWRNGVKRFVTSPIRIKEDILMLEKHLNNCLIVFEDATKYFRTNTPQSVFNFVYDSKQKNIDIIFIYHGFKKILPEMLDNANYITLFKMEEQIHKYEDKIPRYEAIEKIYNQVMASKNPYENKTIMIN